MALHRLRRHFGSHLTTLGQPLSATPSSAGSLPTGGAIEQARARRGALDKPSQSAIPNVHGPFDKNAETEAFTSA